jgi:hypothetical protein
MEKLESSVRDTIKKMSKERLVKKLLKAGLEEEEAIAEMSREQLVNAWAELVATGCDQPKEALAAAGKALGYDVDLERQRLAFEMKKFEREMALKEERLAAERRREEKEATERKERLEREAAEKEERLAREAAEKEERLAAERLSPMAYTAIMIGTDPQRYSQD